MTHYAAQAVDAYTDTSTPEWSFADAAVSRCDLAIARRWPARRGASIRLADAAAASFPT